MNSDFFSISVNQQHIVATHCYYLHYLLNSSKLYITVIGELGY